MHPDLPGDEIESEDTLSGNESVIPGDKSGDVSGENPPGYENSQINAPHAESAKSPLLSQSLTETRKVFSAVTSFFLTLPSIASQTSQVKKFPGPARVLTSEESLMIKEEKEWRKQERD